MRATEKWVVIVQTDFGHDYSIHESECKNTAEMIYEKYTKDVSEPVIIVTLRHYKSINTTNYTITYVAHDIKQWLKPDVHKEV